LSASRGNALDQLASGAVSSVTLTRNTLDTLALRNETLGAFTFVDSEGALAAAHASDLRYRAGATLGPFDGLPIALKANMAVQGWPLTAGLRGRRSVLADADAFLTTRLRAAGAVLIGRVRR
jgi:aspartyl-tRNA(Asn)/glutamyl-tRNA(Gln) amidotransferase subunit A